MACGTRSDSRSGPGTNEVWLGDVGWETWEEVNRIANPTARSAELRLAVHRGERPASGELRPAERLRRPLLGRWRDRRPTSPTSTARTWPAKPARREAAPRSPASPSTRATSYPAQFQGSLFLSDYSRQCIWVMMRRRKRASRSDQCPAVHQRCRRPGPASDRSERRPLLRGLQRRPPPPHRLPRLGHQPRADRGDHGRPDQRRRCR